MSFCYSVTSAQPQALSAQAVEKMQAPVTPQDALPSYVKDRPAQPFKHDIEYCARIVRETLRVGNARQAGFAKTTSELLRQWLVKRLKGHDEVFISAAKVAKRTEQCRRTVKRHFAKLAAQGIHINECGSKGGLKKAAARGIDFLTLVDSLVKEGIGKKRLQTFKRKIDGILCHLGEPIFYRATPRFVIPKCDTNKFGVTLCIYIHKKQTQPTELAVPESDSQFYEKNLASAPMSEGSTPEPQAASEAKGGIDQPDHEIVLNLGHSAEGSADLETGETVEAKNKPSDTQSLAGPSHLTTQSNPQPYENRAREGEGVTSSSTAHTAPRHDSTARAIDRATPRTASRIKDATRSQSASGRHHRATGSSRRRAAYSHAPRSAEMSATTAIIFAPWNAVGSGGVPMLAGIAPIPRWHTAPTSLDGPAHDLAA